MKKEPKLIGVIPTKCACCKKCRLLIFDDGTSGCPYGGPFNGYRKEDDNHAHHDEEHSHRSADVLGPDNNKDQDRGSYYGDVLVESSSPSEEG